MATVIPAEEQGPQVGAQSGASEGDCCLHWHCTNLLLVLLLSVSESKLRLTWESVVERIVLPMSFCG